LSSYDGLPHVSIVLGAVVSYPFWGFFSVVGGSLVIFLQLYAAHEPDVRIGLFRKHHPPEENSLGDIYATFNFEFVHEPLLLNALLALCLNRWLDFHDGPQ
jgi:hypothetical protein